MISPSLRGAIALLVSGCAAGALADPPDDRELIAQAAAERQVAVSENPAADADTDDAFGDDLSRAEQRAQAELTLAQARVELVQARRLLRDGNAQDAARRATNVLALLKKLPADKDVSVYELQAEGILSKTRRSAGKRAESPAPTLSAEKPSAYSETDAAIERDNQRLDDQDRLRTLYNIDEVRRLTQVDEDRVVGDSEVQYPANWRELVARRQQWKDGAIAHGPEKSDKDGRAWHTAIYDITDLTYVAPDFQMIEGLTPSESLRNALDRDALRWHSQIFGGYADDLAAGIPLLRFFGGVDDFEFRGPKYSSEKARQVAEMVSRFLATRNFEPAVEVAP